MRLSTFLLFCLFGLESIAADHICETQDQKAWVTCSGWGFSGRRCVFEFKNSLGSESRLRDRVDPSLVHEIPEDRLGRVCDFVGSKYAVDAELRNCLHSLIPDALCLAPDADD